MVMIKLDDIIFAKCLTLCMAQGSFYNRYLLNLFKSFLCILIVSPNLILDLFRANKHGPYSFPHFQSIGIVGTQ